MSNSKKIIIIVSVILFIMAMVTGVYLGLQKSKRIIGPSDTDNLNTNNSNNISDNNVNIDNNGVDLGGLIRNEPDEDLGSNLKLLTVNPVVDFWVNKNITASSTSYRTFYINKDGDIVEIIKQGDENVVASSNGGEPLRVVSNNNGSFVAVLFSDSVWRIFSVATLAWENMASSVESVTFSPDGKKLGYIKSGLSGSDIYWYDLTVSPYEITKVLNISIVGTNLEWVNDDALLLLSKPTFYSNEIAWEININDGTIKKFASGKGLMIGFGADGVGLKTTFGNNGRIESVLIKSDGSTIYNLPFPTIPNKCTFSGNKIFCSQMNFVTNNVNSLVLPDDYLQHSVKTYDSIYGINFIEDNIRWFLKSDNLLFDAGKIIYLDVASKLLFSNVMDKGLYEIAIIDDLDKNYIDTSSSTEE